MYIDMYVNVYLNTSDHRYVRHSKLRIRVYWIRQEDDGELKSIIVK